MRIRARPVRRAPSDERKPAPVSRFFSQLNILAKELQLRRRRRRRDRQRCACRAHPTLSRRGARQRHSDSVQQVMRPRLLAVFIAGVIYLVTRSSRQSAQEIRCSIRLLHLGEELFLLWNAGMKNLTKFVIPSKIAPRFAMARRHIGPAVRHRQSQSERTQIEQMSWR